MENKSHAVIAVTFLGAFILCIVVVFAWLQTGPSESRRYVIISPYGVSGLQKSSPVKFKGIQVGSVKSIDFDPHQPEKVRIAIGVYPNAYITHATYAEMSMQGITGVKYISLGLTSDQPHTPLKTSRSNPAAIPMHQSLLGSLLSGGGGAAAGQLNKLSNVLDNINKVLSDKNARRLDATLTHLDAAAQRLEAITTQLVPAAKRAPDLAAHGDQLMTDMDQLVKTARQPVRNAGATVKSAKRLAASADQTAAKIQDETVPQLDRTLQHLDRTLTQIDALTRELKSKPQSLIYGTKKPPPGPGEPGFQAPGQGGGNE